MNIFKPLLVSIFVLFTGLALAHSWYPVECCSDKDCFPVVCSQIQALADGTYQYLDKIYTAAQVKPSLDGGCHACPTCLFIVQSS